jgi:hypothetical protein
MSASPSKADIARHRRHVSFVALADVRPDNNILSDRRSKCPFILQPAGKDADVIVASLGPKVRAEYPDWAAPELIDFAIHYYSTLS